MNTPSNLPIGANLLSALGGKRDRKTRRNRKVNRKTTRKNGRRH